MKSLKYYFHAIIGYFNPVFKKYLLNPSIFLHLHSLPCLVTILAFLKDCPNFLTGLTIHCYAFRFLSTL